MIQNHIKFMALNIVSPINADRHKPKKVYVVKYLTKMFARENQEIYSPVKIKSEIERLILTGQMIIKPDGLAVLGNGIFEEGEAVSPEADSLSKIILNYIKSRSEFSPVTDTMDADVIEEITNSIAVIIDKHLSKTSRKIVNNEFSPKAKTISKAILKELKNRRGFRQKIDTMNKNENEKLNFLFAILVDTHILKTKLDNDLSLKLQIKTPKI